MADFLLQATFSNLLFSTVLAAIAWIVQRRVRSAPLANLLWAVVLIKMVTPPLVSAPIVKVPSVSNSGEHVVGSSSEALSRHTTSPISDAGASPLEAEPATRSVSSWSGCVKLAIYAWLAVSALLGCISAFRIARFHWLLGANSRVHHELSCGLSVDVAKQLGVRKHPNVVVTSANVAPFVWWMAGRAIIVVSEQAIGQLTEDDLRFVITHEMAHIKRRDHWFRWLEWLTLTLFWWNPVMWWAHPFEDLRGNGL